MGFLISALLLKRTPLWSAEQGCKIRNNSVACKIHQSLLDMESKNNQSKTVSVAEEELADGKTAYKSSTDVDGIKTNTTFTVDQKELVKAFEDCKQYGAYMGECKPFECMYKHPFVGDKMTKKILGFSDDKCSTEETMPNNGLLACKYPKEILSIVAEHADSHGKKHADKMNAWMNDGTCKISGY